MLIRGSLCERSSHLADTMAEMDFRDRMRAGLAVRMGVTQDHVGSRTEIKGWCGSEICPTFASHCAKLARVHC